MYRPCLPPLQFRWFLHCPPYLRFRQYHSFHSCLTHLTFLTFLRPLPRRPCRLCRLCPLCPMCLQCPMSPPSHLLQTNRRRLCPQNLPYPQFLRCPTSPKTLTNRRFPKTRTPRPYQPTTHRYRSTPQSLLQHPSRPHPVLEEPRSLGPRRNRHRGPSREETTPRQASKRSVYSIASSASVRRVATRRHDPIPLLLCVIGSKPMTHSV